MLGPSFQLLAIAGALGGALSSALLEKIWEASLKQPRFRRKLQYLSDKGLIEPITFAPNTDRIVRLTEEGLRLSMGGRDPESRWNREWDGGWRVAIFDVPETQRALRRRYRQTLRELGFGCLQKSVWVTPDSIEEVTAGIRPLVVDVSTLLFIEGKPCSGEPNREMVERAWNFPDINREYDRYVKCLAAQPPGNSPNMAKWLEAEAKAWHSAFRKDPLLPNALTPPNYRGREAWLRRIAALQVVAKSIQLP